MKIYCPAHEILVHVAYERKPPLNAHADVSARLEDYRLVRVFI